MPERMHRTQILLEPQQHRALAEIARREGRTISDVIRAVVRDHLRAREQQARSAAQRRLAALERIREHCDAIVARRGGQPLDLDVAKLIDQIRGEQDERNLTGLADHRR